MTADHDRSDPSTDTTRLGDDHDPASPAAGWDHLELRGELGRGGFGRVYRAWDPALARDVALKVIRLGGADQAAAALHEGRMLARVRHRHVVSVYAARQVGHDVGLTMELIDGEHLSDYVKRHGPMSAEEATVVGLAVCQALAAVHAAGLLHRDIKARNVMRESGGRIVLMDFGAGVELGPASSGGGGTGTPACMAPEVLLGGDATRASDIYSLAVLMFFLVTGKYPVPGDTAVAIAASHADGRRLLLADARPDLPEGFTRAIERGLSADPDQRYATAGAFMGALAAAMPGAREAPAVVPAPAPAPPRPSRWSRGALLTGATLVTLWTLGLLTSVAYNSTLRIAEFSDDTPFTWLELGLRMVIPFLAVAVLTMVGMYAVRAVWRTMPSLVPALRRPAERVEDSARRVSTRLLHGPNTSEAQYLLLAQVVALGLLLWTFRDVISAYATFADVTEPATIALLGGHRPNAYRITLTAVITLMALAWRTVLRDRRARARAEIPVIVGGIGVIVLLILLLELPYRLIYHSDRPVVAHGDQCCFRLGEQDGRALLYCPNSAAPRILEARSDEVSPVLPPTSIFLRTERLPADDGATCTAEPR